MAENDLYEVVLFCDFDAKSSDLDEERFVGGKNLHSVAQFCPIERDETYFAHIRHTSDGFFGVLQNFEVV